MLIQDADLEYDLEDYDALLEPLAAGREAFVLGSRHGGNAWWKMRQFAGQPLASLPLNCGHWFFTTLLNVLFRQQLKDPFTMYKVFRRDCLFGLDLQLQPLRLRLRVAREADPQGLQPRRDPGQLPLAQLSRRARKSPPSATRSTGCGAWRGSALSKSTRWRRSSGDG